MGQTEWHVQITRTAAEMIRDITDNRIRGKILAAVDELRHDPEQKGKPLIGNLVGYRSLRVAGQCYRVLYRIEQSQVVVYVVAAGIRKDGDKADIYALAKKLLRLGLLTPPSE